MSCAWTTGWSRHAAFAFRSPPRRASICCALCTQCRKPRSRSGCVARPWKTGSRPRFWPDTQQLPELTEPRVEIPAGAANGAGRASPRQRHLQSRSVRDRGYPPAGHLLCVGEGAVTPNACRTSKRISSAIGANAQQVLDKTTVAPSRLERIWQDQYTGSGRNLVRDYVRLCDLDDRGSGVVRRPRRSSADPGALWHAAVFRDSLPSTKSSWVCSVSISPRAPARIGTGFRLSIGKDNQRFAEEMARKLSSVFGLPAVTYSSPESSCTELKLVNRVAALAWQHVFGFANADSITKKIPDLVFNVTEELRVAFLRGYLLGDGTVCKNRIAFSTSSYDIASGIVYALSSLGVVPSMSEREPDGVVREVRGQPCETKHRHWIIAVTAKEDLRLLRAVWQDHAGAAELMEFLAVIPPWRQARFRAHRRRSDGAAHP